MAIKDLGERVTYSCAGLFKEGYRLTPGALISWKATFDVPADTLEIRGNPERYLFPDVPPPAPSGPPPLLEVPPPPPRPKAEQIHEEHQAESTAPDLLTQMFETGDVAGLPSRASKPGEDLIQMDVDGAAATADALQSAGVDIAMSQARSPAIGTAGRPVPRPVDISWLVYRGVPYSMR